MLAIDTETTGLDLYHGVGPFFVTTCDDTGYNRDWSGCVDPLTRKVTWEQSDIAAMVALFKQHDEIVFHNAKFDIGMLASIGIEWLWWDKTRDILLADHLLNSSQPHDLTAMGIFHLGIDITPYETALHEACAAAKRLTRKHPTLTKGWRLAKKGDPMLPSGKGKVWKMDYWLPCAIADRLNLSPEHYLRNVLREYADSDSWLTAKLWPYMWAEIKSRKLDRIYRSAPVNGIIRPTLLMEQYGMTLSPNRLDQMVTDLTGHEAEHAAVCINLAADYKDKCNTCKGKGWLPTYISPSGHRRAGKLSVAGVATRRSPGYTPPVIPPNIDLYKEPCPRCHDGHTSYTLELPKGSSNDSLHHFVFNVLRLTPHNSSKKTGVPSLDKDSLDYWSKTLPHYSSGLAFVKSLEQRRKYLTGRSYALGYKRFWLPLPGRITDTMVLHQTLNITGSATLRFSSQNPNLQNVGKGGLLGEEADQAEVSLRGLFGPAPGREWWGRDYENLELRIPAYRSGERRMIELFEKPHDPPYFGSYHLMNASIIYPELFWPLAGVKGAFKEKYEATYYSWDKNAGFAYQYQGGRATVDRAAHRKGAYDTLNGALTELVKLNAACVEQANRLGYVECIPDNSVDPDRGYPIMCARNERHEISPTIPLSYVIQSTAMWCTRKATVRVQEFLDSLNAEAGEDLYRMILQGHDELLFDFPYSPGQGNRWIMDEVGVLMEKSGRDIGVPTPTSLAYYPVSWGLKVKV